VKINSLSQGNGKIMTLRKKNYLILKLFMLLFLFFYFSNECFSSEKKVHFELSVGIGKDLKSQDSAHILIAPALNMRLRDSIRFRLEANLEIVDDEQNVSFVSGVAPFIRFFISRKSLKPFVEIGSGANYLSRTRIANQALGRHFIFSLMVGSGFKFFMKEFPISISYRVRHLSNAGIYRNNFGLDSHFIMLTFG
jgi:hypothetical protein